LHDSNDNNSNDEICRVPSAEALMYCVNMTFLVTNDRYVD